MDRTEWLAARKNSLGGSDAAPAVGLSPYVTQYALWAEKTSEEIFEFETEDMRRGTLLEPVVCQMYCDATGTAVVKPEKLFKSRKYPFAHANLDGMCVGGSRGDMRKIQEFKTSRNRRGWGEPGSDDIPMVYLCQVTHCMAVVGAEVCDVGVLFGTDFEFAIYTVEFNRDFAGLLMAKEEEFWNGYVVPRVPPPVQSNADAIKRWPKSNGKYAEGNSLHLHVAATLLGIKQAQAELAEMQSQYQFVLKELIGENDGLTVEQSLLATWKNDPPGDTFDLESFKKKHPKVYGKFLKPRKPVRRFLLKEKAPCLQTMDIPKIQISSPQSQLTSQPAS